MTRINLRTLTFAAAATLACAAAAQTASKPVASSAAPQHRPATTTTHTAGPVVCAKLPELSPKIPALPSGIANCAKPLYTITTTPSARLSYVSPMEGPRLAEELGIESSSFSLDYIDTKIGAGPLALPGKWYSIHYTGYLVDGTKFDSSVDRGKPINIPYGEHRVIPGWDTGFDGMHIGGKRRLFIPYQLAYGATDHGPIPAKSMLIFDVELVAQSDTNPEPPPAPPAPAKPATPPPAATQPSTPPPAAKDAKPATPPPAQPSAPGDKPAPPK